MIVFCPKRWPKPRSSRFLFVFFVLLAAIVVGVPSYAQDIRFFRIGTAGIAGTYYPIGGMVALTISNPHGSRPCDQGGSCGIPGLIGVPQSSNGSVSNVEAILHGSLESGFAQSNVIQWAYTGTGMFVGKPPVHELRAITSLYRETMHVVARRDAGINSIDDLRGKRVSLDEPGSGTLGDARLVLAEYGITEKDILPEYIKPNLAMRKIEEGRLDAFFIVAGYPAKSISELVVRKGITLIPISKEKSESLIRRNGLFSRDVVPAGTYGGIPETPTVSVGAQWIVNVNLDEELVYKITKAFWNKAARQIMDNGHPKGRAIVLEHALDGLGIPLHPGSERYYREIGMVK